MVAVILIIALFQGIKSFEINCNYYGYDWNDWGKHYTCGAKLEDVTVQNDEFVTVTSIKGDHSSEHSNDDVKAVDISGQKTYFLIQGLFDFFPSMQELYVFRSDLKHLSRSDFKTYVKLSTVSLSRNHLSHLPYDTFEDMTWTIPNLKTLSKLKELYLFENSVESLLLDDISGNPNLEVIWIYQNKLKFIEPEIFENLPKLKTADFTNNHCINKKFTQDSAAGFIMEVKQNCVSFLEVYSRTFNQKNM